MWKFQRKVKELETPDEKKVRSIGVWHFVLMAFIVLWMVGAYIYLDKKSDVTVGSPPVIVLDSSGGVTLTNFFTAGTNSQMLPALPTVGTKPSYEVKAKYSFGDVVVVKYFYVTGVIIDKSLPVGDSYTVLYKDHNHVLQKVVLPRTMLMTPTDGSFSPVSLLVD